MGFVIYFCKFCKCLRGNTVSVCFVFPFSGRVGQKRRSRSDRDPLASTNSALCESNLWLDNIWHHQVAHFVFGEPFRHGEPCTSTEDCLYFFLGFCGARPEHLMCVTPKLSFRLPHVWILGLGGTRPIQTWKRTDFCHSWSVNSFLHSAKPVFSHLGWLLFI